MNWLFKVLRQHFCLNKFRTLTWLFPKIQFVLLLSWLCRTACVLGVAAAWPSFSLYSASCIDILMFSFRTEINQNSFVRQWCHVSFKTNFHPSSKHFPNSLLVCPHYVQQSAGRQFGQQRLCPCLSATHTMNKQIHMCNMFVICFIWSFFVCFQGLCKKISCCFESFLCRNVKGRQSSQVTTTNCFWFFEPWFL